MAACGRNEGARAVAPSPRDKVFKSERRFGSIDIAKYLQVRIQRCWFFRSAGQSKLKARPEPAKTFARLTSVNEGTRTQTVGSGPNSRAQTIEPAEFHRM